jgi:hypothetical protein
MEGINLPAENKEKGGSDKKSPWQGFIYSRIY